MITSTANAKVKELVELNQKAKARNAAGTFIAEGKKMFLEAPAEQIVAVYVEESFFKEAPGQIQEKLKGLPYETVSEAVFKKISDTTTPQGILCVVRMKEESLETLLNPQNGKAPLLLILEDIQDPGNLGTVLRTAEGAGVNGIIITKNTVDRYHPKTIRATMGSLYRMPCLVTEDISQTVKVLKQAGIRVFAAHLKGSCPYDEPDYTGGTAFLIGNEGNGLKPETAALADTAVRIPMEGQVESLNAAVAAAILMYEAGRQRRL